MANQQQGADKGLRQSAFVERLMADPGQAQDLRMLIGFLGRSTRDRYWRLYVSPELDSWIEFAEDDVVRSEPFATEARSALLDATTVWVRREATLQFTQTVSAQRQAEFLGGDIMSRYLETASLTGQQDLALIGTIIRTASRLVCTRKIICTGLCTDWCPNTGATTCATCLVCNAA
jgi:hypothetical protein